MDEAGGRATYPLDLFGATPHTGWESAVADEDEFLGAFESSSGGRVRLWFSSAAARQRVAAQLRALVDLWTTEAGANTHDPDLLPGCITLRSARPEPPRDWTARYREFFSGVRVGGFFIHPPHVRAQPGLRSLLLTPGPAFGTGMHPTTRMVLESLQEHLRTRRSRTRVLDVGTGSGILAVAATLLGARTVVGLDRDPVAIRSALESAAANETGGRILFREGDYRDPEVLAELQALAPDGFDVILANLSAELLTELWDLTAPLLRRRGRILISGFLHDEAARVLGAFPQQWVRTAEIRLELPEHSEADTWAAAALESRTARRPAPEGSPR